MDDLKIKIEKIDSSSIYADTVKSLGRANSRTLGFLPKGGFDQYIRNQQVLVAVDEHGTFLGYLLYANPSRKIKIHHLCINNEYRGKGIGKFLVDHLKQITTEYIDIRLNCRQDYGIDSMWEKFGFTPMHEKVGKNKYGHLVTTWIYSHGHPDLFSVNSSTKSFVVLDTCVFLDLYLMSLTEPDDRESAYLLADWLQDELELCITDEVYSEIAKHPHDKERGKMRLFADTFLKLNCPSQPLESTYQSLKHLLVSNDGIEVTDIGIRQVARTIASGKSTFIVTTNINLLSYSTKVNEQYGIFIVNPTELIIRLDELRREVEYQPARLAGTQLLKKRVSAEDQKSLINFFSLESEPDFQSKFHRMLAEMEKYECFAVWDENVPIALIAYNREKENELAIPMFRVSYESSSETLARHIIYRTINLSVNEKRAFTKVTDTKLDEFIIRVIQDAGFSSIGNQWLKVNLKTAKTITAMSDHFISISSGDEYKNICRIIAENLISS